MASHKYFNGRLVASLVVALSLLGFSNGFAYAESHEEPEELESIEVERQKSERVIELDRIIAARDAERNAIEIETIKKVAAADTEQTVDEETAVESETMEHPEAEKAEARGDDDRGAQEAETIAEVAETAEADVSADDDVNAAAIPSVIAREMQSREDSLAKREKKLQVMRLKEKAHFDFGI